MGPPYHISNLSCTSADIDKCDERLRILKDITKGIQDDQKRGKYYWMVRRKIIDESMDRTEAETGREQNFKCK